MNGRRWLVLGLLIPVLLGVGLTVSNKLAKLIFTDTDAVVINTAGEATFRTGTGRLSYFDVVAGVEKSVSVPAIELAQSTATTGVTNAATAQGTANTALANAATADGKAVAAQGDATTALGNAATAQSLAETHATRHQSGGADEVATATPGANAIPKTGVGGTLADGWIAQSSVTQHEGAIDLTALSGYVAAEHVPWLAGTAGTRPAFGTAGRYYYATDTGAVSRDTGLAWETLTAELACTDDSAANAAQSDATQAIADALAAATTANAACPKAGCTMTGLIATAGRSIGGTQVNAGNTPYPVLPGDEMIVGTGAAALIVNLEAAATAGLGRTLTIVNSATDTLTIDGSGAEPINGALTLVLPASEPAIATLYSGGAAGTWSAVISAAPWVAELSLLSDTGQALAVGGAGADRALGLPVMTTAQREALTEADGFLVWDTDLGAVYVFDNAAWEAVGGDTTGIATTTAESFTINSDAAGGSDQDPMLNLFGGEGAGAELIRTQILQDSSATRTYFVQSLSSRGDSVQDRHNIYRFGGSAASADADNLDTTIEICSHFPAQPAATMLCGSLVVDSGTLTLTPPASGSPVNFNFGSSGSFTQTMFSSNDVIYVMGNGDSTAEFFIKENDGTERMYTNGNGEFRSSCKDLEVNCFRVQEAGFDRFEFNGTANTWEMTATGGFLLNSATIAGEKTDYRAMLNLTTFVTGAGIWSESVDATDLNIEIARTPAATTDYIVIPVSLPTRSTTNKGIKPIGLKVKYVLGVADLDDVTFNLKRMTLPADGTDAFGNAATWGTTDAEYNTAHDTAAERGDKDAHASHTVLMTFASPSYAPAADDMLFVKITVDGDAAGLGTFELDTVELLYSATWD